MRGTICILNDVECCDKVDNPNDKVFFEENSDQNKKNEKHFQIVRLFKCQSAKMGIASIQHTT